MDEKLIKALQDYVATVNSGRYSDVGELNSKFPELSQYNPEVLTDYVSTANSGKYSTWEEINSKFPEFLPKQNEVSSQGSETTSQTSEGQSATSQEPEWSRDARQVSEATQGETRFDLGLNNREFVSPIQLELPEGTTAEVSIQMDAPTERTFSQNLENSLNNNLNQLKGFDERLALTTGAVAKKLLGMAVAGSIYGTQNLVSEEGQQLANTLGNMPVQGLYRYAGLDFNQVQAGAMDELDRLSQKTLEVGNFTDGEIASGVVDSVLALLNTALVSTSTGGVGLFTDMVGGSIADANQAKADRLGISVEELYNTNQEDFWAPSIIGGIGYGLEKIGLRGVKSALNRKITSGLGRYYTAMAMDMNREGMTEALQYGLDAVNIHLANGGNIEDTGSVFAQNFFSKEGLEQYLKGMAGTGALSTPSMIVNTVTNNESRNQAVTLDNQRRELITELQNEETMRDPIVRDAILSKIERLSSDIQKIVDEDFSENGANMTAELIEQTVNITTRIADIDNKLTDSKISETVKSALQDEKTALENELNNLRNEDTQISSNTAEGNTEVSLSSQEEVNGVQQNEDVEFDDIDTTVDIETATDSTILTPELQEDIKQDSSFWNDVTNSEARKSRLDTLRERLRVDNQNLGIANDPLQDAKWMRDATEFAILSIVDGTVKTAQALANVLGITKEQAQPIYNDAVRLAEGVINRPERRRVKSDIIETTFGGTTGKITLTTRQALKAQFQTLNRGAKDMEANVKELGQTINAYMQSQKERLRGAKVSSSVVNRVARAVQGVTNEAQLERALNVVEKYIDNAEFRAKMDRVESQQKSLKKMAKQMPADRQKAVTAFANVSPIDLSDTKLESYLDIMQRLEKVAFADVGEITNQELQSYVDEAKLWNDKRVAERLLSQELREAHPTPQQIDAKIENKKKKLKELGLDDSEIDLIVDGENKEWKQIIADLEAKIEEIKAEQPTRLDILRQQNERLVASIKSNSTAIRNSLKTKEDKMLFDVLLKNLDSDNILDKDLLVSNYLLYNISVEGSMVGAGTLVSNLQSATNLKKNATFLSEVFGNLGNIAKAIINWKPIRAQFNLQIEALLGKTAFRSVGELKNAVGLTDYQRNLQKTRREIDPYKKQIDSILRKNKGKWNNPTDKVKMGMYTIVSQSREAWTEQEVNENYLGRWRAIVEDYDILRGEGRRSDGSSITRKRNKPLLDNLTYFIQEDGAVETNPNALVTVIRDTEGKISEVVPKYPTAQEFWNEAIPSHYKEAYQAMLDAFKTQRDGFLSIQEAFGNKVIEKDWNNYFPISYYKYGETKVAGQVRGKVDITEDGANGIMNTVRETSGSGNNRTILGAKKPRDMVFNYGSMDNFVTDLSKMVYDKNTTLDRHVMNNVTDFRRNGLNQVGVEMKESDIGQMEHLRVIVDDKVKADIQELGFEAPEREVSTYGKRIFGSFRDILTNVGLSSALGGVTQPLKQITPMVEIMARLNNPANVVTALKLLVSGDPRVKALLQEGIVSNRNIVNNIIRFDKVGRRVNEAELNKVLKAIASGTEKTSDIIKWISDKSLWALSTSDSNYANLGWLSLYLDKAGDSFDLDTPNNEAIGYADHQNDIIMNASERSAQGKFSSQGILKAIAPLMSFAINSTQGFVVSLDKMVSNLNKGDYKIGAYYAKEASANMANLAIFHVIGYWISKAGIAGASYIGDIASDYFINALAGDDEDDEVKAELEQRLRDGKKIYDEEIEKAYARNFLNRGTYAMTDLFFRGTLIGNLQELIGKSITDPLYESIYGDAYLDSIDYKKGVRNQGGDVEDQVAQYIVGFAGITGMGIETFMEAWKSIGVKFEDDDQYLKSIEGFTNAEGTEIMVDDYLLTEEGRMLYDKPEIVKQGETGIAILYGLKMLGLSDQTMTAFSRQVKTITKKTLTEMDGRPQSKKALDKLKKNVKSFNKIDVSGYELEMDSEKASELKINYLNKVVELREEFKSMSGTVPKSLIEENIADIARQLVIFEMLDKNPELMNMIEESVDKDIKTSMKESAREQRRFLNVEALKEKNNGKK